MRISLVLMALLPIALFASSKTDAREPKTAAPDVYEIKTVNVAGEKLTATFQGDIVTLEARPDTDVIVNGAEASFKDLEPGMNAKVTLAEPGVAARIEANGEVAANSTTAFGSATTATKTESPLTKEITQAPWTWEIDSAVTGDVQFFTDGTVVYTFSATHKTYSWTWVELGPFKVDVIQKNRKHSVIQFDQNTTKFTEIESDVIQPGERLSGHIVNGGNSQPQ
jgi:hypothetical protein